MLARSPSQAFWVGRLSCSILVGLFSLTALLRMSATDTAPEEFATPVEDLVPPAPKRLKPPKLPAQDWAQWNDVEHFRGHYEARRSSDRSKNDGVTVEESHALALASGDFELERDASGNWTVIRGQIAGSTHETSSSDRWSYHGRSTADADFSGKASDFHLHLDTKRGEWNFFVNGHMEQPYALTSRLTSRSWEKMAWETENRSDTEQRIDYAHGSMQGKLPLGPPAEIQGKFSLQNTTGSVTDYRATVILVPEYKDLELIVELEGLDEAGKAVAYEKWIPRGTVTGAAGSRLKVKARLQAKDGGPAKARVENFSFTLSDTSREPGVCLNYPLPDSAGAGKTAGPDLKFAPGGETDVERQQLDVPSSIDNPDHPHAETRIDCFDFGAWANLSVTAELADGRTITGHFKGDTGGIVMTVPKRTGGSCIADAWKSARGITAGDDDDAEKLPDAGKFSGDGFTLYEEYRGFVENGRHIEGDPAKMDLFVRNFIGGDARPGIDLFANVTGAAVHHRLRPAEFDEKTRVMNSNHQRGPHHVDQHGVFMKTEAGRDGGGAVPTNSGKGLRSRPGLCFGIYLQPRNAVTSITSNENLPASELVFSYDRAVAHELLHAVGVEHHGKRDYHARFYLMFADDPRNPAGKPLFMADSPISGIFATITDESTGRDFAAMLEPDLLLVRESDRPKIFDQLRDNLRQSAASKGGLSGQEYTVDQLAEISFNENYGELYYYVGAEHGECSGDEGCIMRYFFAGLFEKQGGARRTYYKISDKRTERAGMALCDSRIGTGINDPARKPQPRYGNTNEGWGECAEWIVFNDGAPSEPVPKP